MVLIPLYSRFLSHLSLDVFFLNKLNGFKQQFIIIFLESFMGCSQMASGAAVQTQWGCMSNMASSLISQAHQCSSSWPLLPAKYLDFLHGNTELQELEAVFFRLVQIWHNVTCHVLLIKSVTWQLRFRRWSIIHLVLETKSTFGDKLPTTLSLLIFIWSRIFFTKVFEICVAIVICTFFSHSLLSS